MSKHDEYLDDRYSNLFLNAYINRHVHAGSFEYPQHMFWLRNKKNNFQVRTLIWRPDQLYLLIEKHALKNWN